VVHPVDAVTTEAAVMNAFNLEDVALGTELCVHSSLFLRLEVLSFNFARVTTSSVMMTPESHQHQEVHDAELEHGVEVFPRLVVEPVIESVIELWVQ
jgi:hypothetical protein